MRYEVECMKKPSIIILILAICSLAYILWLVALSHYHTAKCRRHLEQICKASLIYAGDFDEVYPDSLRRLVEFGISPSILTCPALKTQSGAVRDIDQWSGYRLVTGISRTSQPSSVFAYCPAENHDDRRAIVAFTDKHIETLRKDEFEMLLAEQGIVQASKEP